VWALSSVLNERLHQLLRSKFYMEKKTPTTQDDAMPVANLIQRLRPDMLTVALDPEGTGPDTHYKVLQIVADGIRVSL
jgi:glucosamine-6-phosphate deaminase